MAKLGAIGVHGISGAIYKFVAYSLDTRFKPHRPAVYVATRRREVEPMGAFKHRRLSLDQTDDVRKVLAHDGLRSRTHRANCICVHFEEDQTARSAICKDLRKQ